MERVLLISCPGGEGVVGREGEKSSSSGAVTVMGLLPRMALRLRAVLEVGVSRPPSHPTQTGWPSGSPTPELPH